MHTSSRHHAGLYGLAIDEGGMRRPERAPMLQPSGVGKTVAPHSVQGLILSGGGGAPGVPVCSHRSELGDWTCVAWSGALSPHLQNGTIRTHLAAVVLRIN